VEFHPNAANAYRDRIRDLKKALAESDEDSRLTYGSYEPDERLQK
jgi:hypothetical protein